MGRPEEIQANSQVIVDGDVSAEKLVGLIRRNGEEAALDYKRSYDLGAKITKDKLEFVRDTVAMANTDGGYIVLGVDEDANDPQQRFKPIGVPSAHLSQLDPMKLKQLVERYVNVSIDIRLHIHSLPEYENRTFALVYVPVSPHLPVIFETIGQCVPEGETKTIEVFRNGDLVVRDGASSRKVDQDGWREIVTKVRRRERDRWTEEILGVRPLVERLDRLIAVLEGGSSPANTGTGSPPRPTTTDLALGTGAFENIVLTRLRTGDEVGLRWYLSL